MQLKIEIDTAALKDPFALSRVLTRAQEWVRENKDFPDGQFAAGFTLRDTNGDEVGQVSLRLPGFGPGDASREPPL